MLSEFYGVFKIYNSNVCLNGISVMTSQVMEQSSENQTEIILDSIADGVFTVDMDLKVTSFNRAAEKITGIQKEEALGRHCWEVFRASICEKDCALHRTIETGQQIINQSIFIVSSEGERIPISISTAILKDRNGNVI